MPELQRQSFKEGYKRQAVELAVTSGRPIGSMETRFTQLGVEPLYGHVLTEARLGGVAP